MEINSPFVILIPLRTEILSVRGYLTRVALLRRAKVVNVVSPGSPVMSILSLITADS